MLFSYLASEFVRRPLVFLRRWYVDATEIFWAAVAEHAAGVDRIFAVKIMLRTLFLPLYGDYTIIGRILGPIFRFGRIILTLPFFAIYYGAAVALWLWWVLIPPYLLYRMLVG
jgi:hypothetical protein